MDSFTLYSGITKESWLKTWKDRELKDKATNVTSDFEFALDYSYSFKTGKYEDLVIEISNIPLDAFVGTRSDDYKDDDDFEIISELSNEDKLSLIDSKSLFIVNLKPYKESIEVKLIDASSL